MQLLSRFWQRPEPAPQSALEYVYRVALAPETLAYYRAIRARFDSVAARGQMFARRLVSHHDVARAAARRFESTLTEEDFQAALDAASEAATIKALLEHDPQVPHRLMVSHGAPWEAVCREFPDWRQKLCALVEEMRTRIAEEIRRVTPIEEAAQREEVERRAQDYGVEEREVTAPPPSPVMNRLNAYLRSLDQCLDHLRSGRHELLESYDVFFLAAGVLDPLVKHFQGQEQRT